MCVSVCLCVLPVLRVCDTIVAAVALALWSWSLRLGPLESRQISSFLGDAADTVDDEETPSGMEGEEEHVGRTTK